MSTGRLPIIYQNEAAECGLASLCMIARYHGHSIDLNSLRNRFAISLKGSTLEDLMQIGEQLGFTSRALRLELSDIPELSAPSILHWDLNHFVVLKRSGRNLTVIHDPARGVLKLPLNELSKHFTGVALEFHRSSQFELISESKTLKLSHMWNQLSNVGSPLIQTIVLSIILQMLIFIMPFALQIIIDSVMTTEDTNLLLTVCIAFAAAGFIATISQFCRDYVVIMLSQELNLQILRGLVSKLIRLPTEFYEKRYVGDILSRLGSVRFIQDVISGGIASFIIDGIVAVVAGIVLVIYSLDLSLILFSFLLIHAVVSLAAYRIRRPREDELAVARAEEQSHLIETIRANRLLKLFGKEQDRESSWLNFYNRVNNASVRTGVPTIAVKASQTLTSTLGYVFILFVGTKEVFAGDLTLGMLLAFLLFRGQLSERFGVLVERLIDYRLLRVHLDRIADIAHKNPEPLDAPSIRLNEPVASIVLSDVHFRYGMNDAVVLSGVNLRVDRGDYVAIIGDSGGGKTTLLKILQGLYPPTQGRVLINDVPLQSFGLRRWRRRLGVVQQDDDLFAGTILENIAFFEGRVDQEKLINCSKRARIHDEIMAMPMNYLSLVGDMGSTLSGGQKQRIFLARALYGDPEILVLDEGTANLDPANESKVAALIEGLPITRIIVSHRWDLACRAKKVFKLDRGTLIPVN